jgi:hypothetical protein
MLFAIILAGAGAGACAGGGGGAAATTLGAGATAVFATGSHGSTERAGVQSLLCQQSAVLELVVMLFPYESTR